MAARSKSHPAVSAGYAQQEYRNYLSMIASGYPVLAEPARDMAEAFGFPTDDLEVAVRDGRLRLYESYLILLKSGYERFAEPARTLAAESGFDMTPLEALLQQARQ